MKITSFKKRLCTFLAMLFVAGTLQFSQADTVSAGYDYGCRGDYTRFYYYYPGGLHGWKTTDYLRRGSRGNAVKYLQWLLVDYHGYDLGTSGPDRDGVDGIFGWKTAQAVLDMQLLAIRQGAIVCGSSVSFDGIVGPQMWTLLHEGDAFD